MKAEKKQERSFLEQISTRTKRNSGGEKELFSVNVFECAVINRAHFKGSGNLRRFLSRLTNFLQYSVGAGKSDLLHIRTAGCLKKISVCGRTPPIPYTEPFSSGKRTSVETGHFSKSGALSDVILQGKVCFLLMVHAFCLGIFRRGLWVFLVFNFCDELSFEVLLNTINLKYIVLVFVTAVV